MSIKRDVDEDRIYQNKKKDYASQIAILSKEASSIIEDERNEVLELEAFIDLLKNLSEYYRNANYVQK